MTFASSNRSAINIVEETVLGVTPATPTLKALRFKGESLNYNLSNISSDEIRSDRNTANLIQVKSDVAGDIDFELSYLTFEDLIEGALANDWTTLFTFTGTNVSTTSGTPDLITSATAGFVAGGLVVGQWVQVSGFTNPANNGFFRLSAVSATQLSVVQTTIVTESAGASVTIKGCKIRNGTALKSYTVQRQLADVTQFFNYLGCVVNTLSLDFKTGQILTGKVGLMGMSSTNSGSQIAGATITPANSNTPMNAVSNVASVLQDYSTMTAKFNSLTVNLSNNVRAQTAIGTLGNVGMALGKVEVTGNIELYFEDSTMYTKYINATAFSLSFVVQDASSQTYIVTIPNAKFESGSVVAGGLDTDIMFSATWRGIYDATSGCSIQIDKFA